MADYSDYERKRADAEADWQLEIDRRGRHGDSDLVAHYMNHQRARETARGLLEEEKYANEPSPFDDKTLGDLIEEGDDDIAWNINRVLVDGHNVLLVATPKAGKTTLTHNLARSWADGAPFLGNPYGDIHDGYEVLREADRGAVAIWQFELGGRQAKAWLVKQGIDSVGRVRLQNLRESRFNLASQSGQRQSIEWLKRTGTGLWIVDTLRRAYKGNINDNDELKSFTETFDSIRGAVDTIHNSIVSHHVSGRKEFAEGDEHALGATEIDAWPDATWYLVTDRERSKRFFRAFGRDVDVPEMELVYEEATNRLWLAPSGSSRREARAHDDLMNVLSIVGANPNITATDLKARLEGRGNTRGSQIQATISAGYVTTTEGARNAKFHRLTAKGEELLKTGIVR